MLTTPTLFLAEQQANTVDSGVGGDDQREPQIVGLANGTFVVLWESNTDVGAGDEPGTDIIGQLYDAEGNKIGGEFQANNQNFFDDEGDFTAAALPNGNFVVVYEDTDPNGTSLRFEVMDPTGAYVTGGNILADPGADILGDPSVTVVADGSFLVTYQRDVGATVNTEVVKVSAAGVAGAPVLAISGSDSGFQTDTTTLANGNFVVVSRNGAADDGIVVRLVDAAGVPQGVAAFVANTGANGDADSAPTVAALTGGGFVVAWQNTDANDTDVQFQVFNAAGAAVGGIGAVNGSGSSDNNNEAEVIGLSDGGFVVVYDDDDANTLALQRYDAAGAAVGTEVTVTNSDSETTPTVTLTDDGRLLIGWTTSLAGDSDVEFAILDPRESVINGDNTGETTTSRLDGATVNGNGGNDALLGQAAADTLNGGDGGDLIRGRDGADLIQGGFDADTIFGDAGDDTIFAMTQVDPTGSSVGDTISGGVGFDTIIGSNGDDEINGDANGDLLTGGAGADLLNGGGGADRFEFAAGEVGGDAVNGGADFDTIAALASVNVNNATLTSIEEVEFSASTLVPKAINVAADQIGAGLAANLLVDGNANNVADTLRITMGADISVNLSGFTFQDFDTGGTENDRIVVLGDADGETVAGSSVRDDIFGNGGNDRLGGGGGVDAIRGGDGNDLYFVNAAGEAIEAANEGLDTVRSAVSYTLGANIERLELLGAANNSGTGNALNNRIEGNGGDNILNGRDGNDLLIGGAGVDRFVFNTALAPGLNVDTIDDFTVGVDVLRLDNAVFAGLPAGALNPARFQVGASADDGNDQVIYNDVTGALFFDQDGVGGAAQVKFANLDAGLALTAADFFVV